MKGFLNVNAYVEGEGVIKTNIAIQNGKIVAIGKDVAVTEPFNVAGGAIVLPGFIDEHIHGAGGCDAMDGTAISLKTIANAIASEGTTCFLATTMTQSRGNINRALKAIGDYIDMKEPMGAEVLGVHLEGPFISPKFCGAQPLEYIEKPSVKAFKEYEQSAGGNIKIVTLAPEVDGADELIKYLSEKSIVPSVGHSSAGFSDVEKGISFGLKNVTHTYNAQTPLHHREVGVVGSAMLIDELGCEVICDMVHVSKEAVKLLVKNKPHDKITLITDSMRAKHLPDGESELGGQKVFVCNGQARLADGTLAGSVLKMNDAIKNMNVSVGVSFTDSVDFATINPARNLGLDKVLGSIKVGKRADFAVIDTEFNVLLTVRAGNVIYSKVE